MSNFYFHRGGWVSPPEAKRQPRKALLDSNWLLVAALLATMAIAYVALGGHIPRINPMASATSGAIDIIDLVK